MKKQDKGPSTLQHQKKLPSALSKMTTVEEVHNYYQKIISCMPGNVFWLDKNCITQGCNDNVLKFVGLNHINEFIGLTYEEMGKIARWQEGHAKLYKQDDIEVMSTGEPKLNIEDPPIHDEKGQPTYYLSSRVPIYDGEQKEVIGVVGISVDISEQKKLQLQLDQARKKAEIANQAKTEFLENMRHDIRTPLSGIVGFAELLRAESNETHIKDYADNLVASSHALLSFMNEILETVRVSSGEVPLMKRKFPLQQILEQVITLCRPKAEQKKLTLTLELGRQLPRFVIGDRIRLHRIALELIGNALNFTNTGEVHVRLDLAKKNRRQLIIRLSVEDTGIGIPLEKQQDIYLQFKRLTPSYQGIYKGSGLGLYVVKQFIDELEGEIYVESKPGKGSRFTCLIPLQEALIDNDEGVDEVQFEKNHLTPTSLPSSITLQTGRLPRQSRQSILVVEDNSVAQTIASTLLSSLHCQVDIATNGQQALQHCKKKNYDLIFMDIGLGDGLDGYEVTHLIRRQEQQNQHTPIIALTAHMGKENKQRCIKAGMNAVLSKPLIRNQVNDILNHFIPARRHPSETQSLVPDLPDSPGELFKLDQWAILDSYEGKKNCGSQTLFIEMLTLLIDSNELPKDRIRLTQTFEKNDFELLEKTAHKIKSGAVYVGTARLKMACQYLEHYLKSGKNELVKELYQQTQEVISDTITTIRSWLQQNQ